ncbi:MAG TPA: Ig-like domain-containing protein, partial [Bacteroidales bacterium]|nr:Ig-like domain-containing protein [Bacteroidales bacterium]
MKKTALLSISIISICIFTMSLAAADTKNLHLSSNGENPCSIPINQDLTFTIPNAIYDAGPLIGKTALKIDFKFFGEQKGQLVWELGDIGTSSSSSSCSVSIDPDLSFTLANAIYDGGPLVGKMELQADFEYSGEQAGSLLWRLADLKFDDAPSDPTPDPSPVVLSKTQVALESGNSETITVSGGTGYYTVNTSNSQVATAVISGNSIEVTGLLAGSASITVEDSGGETANLSVTVSSPTTPSGNCGAYVAPGVWKQFDCYNLAAIGKTTNDDPFTPSWRLIGGYWQWGRKGPNSSQWYDTNTEHFDNGPTGPDTSEANDGSFSGRD